MSSFERAPVWRARWIWGAAPEGDPSTLLATTVAPAETWNRFFYLRRGVELAAAPATAPCRVTADSRFVLFVNGSEVARGPARSVPERLSWLEVDLGPHLREGANVVAALVRFYGRSMAWWRPARPSFHLGYGGLLLEAPAIGLVTDASWRALPAPYRQRVPGNGFYPVTEILDGTGVPGGWARPGFDDTSWQPAVELLGEFLSDERLRSPSTPYTAMEHDGIAALTQDPQPLARVATAAVPAGRDDEPAAAYRDRDAAGRDAAVTFDAGRITLSTPWVEVDGEAGAVVDLFAGEDLRPDGVAEIRPRAYALRYTLGGGGPERVEGYEAVGFRYLTAVTRGRAQVLDAGAIERRYPRPEGAFFACDDERLTRIWEVGARTLDVCSTDAFVDCPGREQRAWVGDAYVHGLLTYVASPDWRLARRNLGLCAQSQRADGLLSMSATGDLSTSTLTIPDYSLHWIRALARYLEHSGDVATARRLLPTALQIVDTFERWRDRDGLLHGVPGWVFVDWAQTERAEVVAALNALHAAALDDLARLVRTCGGAADEADALLAGADQTRSGFDLFWDPRRRVYVDAADAGGRRRRVSQQTNAVAILGRCAPPDRWAGMLDHALDPDRLVVTATPADLPDELRLLGQWLDPSTFTKFDEEHDVVLAQPFFAHFLHQAVVAAGRGDLLGDLCRRWWAQIERGNTTFEEYWDAPAGQASRAHAWAATPTYDLTTHVLGVSPAAPGYARAAVRPRLGDLERLRGRVPTPRGWLSVEVSREGATVEVPEGCEATVELTDGDLPAAELGPGVHRLGGHR